MLENCLKYVEETIETLEMLIKSYEEKVPESERIIYILNNIIHKQGQIRVVLKEIKKVVGG